MDAYKINLSGIMAGRKALITGAGTGIGKGIALEFAGEGAEVVLHYYNEKDSAYSAVKTIGDAGGKALAVPADLSKLEGITYVANTANNFLNGIDVLVNNAGITMNLPFNEVTPEQYDLLFNVNVRSAYFLTQKITLYMVEQKRGHIINLASQHAFHAHIEHSVYASTKAAIVALTRNLGIELAPKGIRVNAIAPGWCLVENHYKVDPNADFEEAAKNIPAGRQSTPEEIGKLAVMLTTPIADHFVGTTIHYDGGIGSIFPGSNFNEPMKVRFGKDYVPGIE